jgi:uncharacterized protein YecE (DUF72 family)
MAQAALFDAEPLPAGGGVQPAPAGTELQALAARLHQRWGGRLHLGTSSWHFPGWAGQVYASAYPEARLSRDGLAAYAQHPLLNTVSLDRAFYRPLEAATYRALAAQVPAHFRFVVKAPALLSDATEREPATGAALRDNPHFLDADAAVLLCAQPATAGLGDKLGVLVWQLSPLPRRWLDDEPALLRRLGTLWQAVEAALPPGAQQALELRDPSLLTPALAATLKFHGVRPVLGLHDRMPAAEAQLPLLRATWPGDLVCRWNLQRGLRYAEARDAWAPFDRFQAEDLPTRQTLVKVVVATLQAGRAAFITVNNKAEGCAPASVLALAQALDQAA